VERPVLGEHRHELLDPPRSGLGALGVRDAVQKAVAVGAGERREEGLRLRILIERRPEVGRDGGSALPLVGGVPAAVGAGLVTLARPDGRIRSPAINSVALSRLIRDHLLRGPRGVKRWSQKRSSNARFCPSIHPWQRAASSASA
jgi:hypothetical protein